MIVLIGESASGKSSIEKMLATKYEYRKIISYTTRTPREHEIDGVDYHFIQEKDFFDLKKHGYFAETAIYNHWYYGTAKADYELHDLAVLTPYGLRQIKKIGHIPIVSFYIEVPRRERLIKMLQRGDNIDEACRRSVSDVGQFDGVMDEVDVVINNDGYRKTVEELAYEIHMKYNAICRKSTRLK